MTKCNQEELQQLNDHQNMAASFAPFPSSGYSLLDLPNEVLYQIVKIVVRYSLTDGRSLSLTNRLFREITEPEVYSEVVFEERQVKHQAVPTTRRHWRRKLSGVLLWRERSCEPLSCILSMVAHF